MPRSIDGAVPKRPRGRSSNANIEQQKNRSHESPPRLPISIGAYLGNKRKASKRIAGACRTVYNWGLERRKEHYAEHGKTLPYAAQNLELTALKNRPGLKWLKEADSQALQKSLRDLERAFVNFFEGRARFPKFKRAKDERFALRIPQRVKIEGEQVYCLKIGWIALRLSRPVEGLTKSASFKTDAAGHWHVCLIQEFEPPEVALPAPQNPAGVDLGLSQLCHALHRRSNPGPEVCPQEASRRQRRAQRTFSRRKQGRSLDHD